MTDELFGDEGGFGDDFFASLAASPDDPADDGPAPEDDLFADDDAFLYETEEDGSFETEAADFDADDEPFALEPDFDPDHDFDHEDEHEFGPDTGPGFGTGL
ncbi:hypothetical protein [Glycomyces harbinensis]|uniref:Uncharacterized protein n=1 Tax=Glycomyces harbinensis TaxID=58114 RepID=A0A1G7DI96_9ACTN|nr:hypothetical protein [Glycomyces harbinensis]SDE51241.1 hypothetical protein SAMN05216270_12546 [Glycomyces harbinensis]